MHLFRKSFERSHLCIGIFDRTTANRRTTGHDFVLLMSYVIISCPTRDHLCRHFTIPYSLYHSISRCKLRSPQSQPQNTYIHNSINYDVQLYQPSCCVGRCPSNFLSRCKVHAPSSPSSILLYLLTNGTYAQLVP